MCAKYSKHIAAVYLVIEKLPFQFFSVYSYDTLWEGRIMQKHIRRNKKLACHFCHHEVMTISILVYFLPVFVIARNIILCLGILLNIHLHVKNCERSEIFPIGMLTN